MAAAALDASLVAVVLVSAASDLRTRVIPDGPLLIASLIALGIGIGADPAGLAERLGAGAGAAAFLLAAALLRPEGMGLGDVKLSGVIGLYLGTAVIPALIAAFTAGTLAGLALIVRHGWAARTRTIPFAPCLALGALLALLAGP
jgi:leader peptidase (prepilin peptidase)/N-methyltransferase